MAIFTIFKVTVLSLCFCFLSCGQKRSPNSKAVHSEALINQTPDTLDTEKEIVVAANRTEQYLSMLKSKKIAVVANQTSVIFKKSRSNSQTLNTHTHLVDSLLNLGINIEKVFAPEHGFRGKADAGELVNDGVDNRTGLPIISLHGKNKKPRPEHLRDIDFLVFDIQDVGVRFYTYITTLQLVMEACADAQIPVVILDRPNPNAHYIDGPTMEAEHTSFLGMQKIPLVYGMTIGEYATMINEEGWLQNGLKVDLTVIPLENYSHDSDYSLPIRPSPNLPNNQSINIYPSLGLFEGTNINAGRGTEFQFQRYGASFLDSTVFDLNYVPQPNFGSKYPKEEGKQCFGEDLTKYPRMSSVSLQWIIKAYKNATDKSKFFNTNGFTKHAGTEKLQQQIEDGLLEEEIKATWQADTENFKTIRTKYLIY